MAKIELGSKGKNWNETDIPLMKVASMAINVFCGRNDGANAVKCKKKGT